MRGAVAAPAWSDSAAPLCTTPANTPHFVTVSKDATFQRYVNGVYLDCCFCCATHTNPFGETAAVATNCGVDDVAVPGTQVNGVVQIPLV